MSKNLLLSWIFVLLTVGSTWAQGRTVTGTVKETSGEPLPGVSVVVKGTTNGTITDLEGAFSISIDEPETAVLVFSFIGLTTQEVTVGNQTKFDVEMTSDVKQLDEVVVTALGVERDERSLGYSAQQLKSEDLTQVRETNIVNSLSGKVAGVQINSNSNMGGSSRILIRGASSITGNNQPLFVVDGVPLDNSNFGTSNQARGAGGYDYGNAAQDINPDDIASMTVLKGAAAAALYGSRASNGVIVITTKSGKGKKGIGVSVNSGVTFEKVNLLPSYQNEYGGGTSEEFAIDPESGLPVVNFYADQSWGPKLQGQQVVQWHNIYDYEQGLTSQLTTSPWVANPDNVKDFFQTGVTLTNNVAVQGGNDEANFRLSYTNKDITGIFPNSHMSRNTFNFAGSTKLNDKLTVNANGSYVSSRAKGRPGTGYDDGNVMQQFNQWGQRQWSNDLHKNYKNPDGSQRSWNRSSIDNPDLVYSNNPYWVRYENFQDDDRERFFGNVGMNYKITEEISVSAKAMTDFYTDSRRERLAVGSIRTDQAQGRGYYSEDVIRVKEDNYEFLTNYNKTFDNEISLNAFVGVNRRTKSYRRNYAETQDGLSVPGLYTLTNSVGSVIPIDDGYDKIVNSVFGSASVGWRNMVFVDATFRNDWSSTLPTEGGQNSFFYPSVTTSFVFSELGSLANSNLLSFGKLRFGWASVGNDTDPYRLAQTYPANPQGGFGGNPIYTTPNTMNNSELKPETTESFELGLDLRFLQDRIGLDATVYSSRSYDQIIPVQTSAASGFVYKYINAGLMTNKGVELMLSGTPIKSSGGFQWDVVVNWAMNRNKVVELEDNLETLRLGTAPFAVTIEAVEGESYATIYGTAYQRDENGNKIVGDDGLYLATEEKVALGSAMADWTGGITNSVSYKGFTLTAVIDGSFGGKIFSTTNMWGRYSGMFEETTANNIRETGIVAAGVKRDGSVNDINVDAKRYFQHDNGYNIAEADVYDASYIKLREVSLAYKIPNKLISKVGIQDMVFSVVGRNLALLYSEVPHIDPEYAVSSGNVQGLEGAATPMTASWGFNLNFKF
ncbi:SusC/RagA family TonB-linked outer membrane protein [Aureibacter tunicatorum]|uniref:TonB-linked SusC/RagA family outer membrane protein n=1 Tax=Aureibacter tunicatorum TaxID=866807 RepID=A0AAE3XR60_9BACT|nr:SusC/RagA family TonB-linked outer membrane protein [Aureibacter tunicatorum]MDR6240376.1 TonB-linked SusC/RagA family outer membrane protein [Aureibacter tunicatorum]BDD05743.1 SusC/RagA family TonB-linked outer membrane protein [Aureibacter tunicatorum]